MLCPLLRRVLVVAVLLSGLQGSVSARDWPAYGGDAARSAVTEERIELPLEMLWTWQPCQAPSPAWPEPAKELHRLDFDYAPQPVVSGGMIFVPSSADDAVRALDLESGAVRWRFVTGGPVRFAPALAGGRLYAASDDGWLYCLEAATGRLLWRFRGAPGDDVLLGNGRLISRWPLRSGVVVADGTAYFTAGMWPAEGVYVHAVDAETGEPRWCNDSSGQMYMDLPHTGASGFSGVSPQGYLAVTGDALIVPTGRSLPALYDRHTGELRCYEPARGKYDGGSWLTTAGELYFNESHVGGPNIDVCEGESAPRPGDGLMAYSVRTGRPVARYGDRHRAVAAGSTLYASGKGEIATFDLGEFLKESLSAQAPRWRTPHGRTYALALAGRTLLAGGAGTLTAFDADTGKQAWQAEVDGQVRALAVANGHVVAATDRGTLLCFAHSDLRLPTAQLTERSTWKDVAPASRASLAADVVRRSGATEGYAVVLGEADASLALALAMQTDLHVICAVPGEDRARAERLRLLDTDMHGTRVAVHALGDGARLPFASYFADLVVVTSPDGPPAAEAYRLTRPCGGVLCPVDMEGTAAAALLAASGAPEGEARRVDGGRMLVRGRLPGAADWRCQWGDAGRSGAGRDERVRMPLRLLWFGGPGPARMMNRHWGTSTPLSVDGRLFVTGQHEVMAFDAYNGRTLWVHDLTDAARRDTVSVSANFVADDDSLYVTVDRICHRLDQATGKPVATYPLPPSASAPEPLEEGKSVALESVSVDWPARWLVFGPFPKGTPPAAAEALGRVPERMLIGETAATGRELLAVNGVLDFTCLYGGYGFEPLAPGQQPRAFPRGEAVSDMDAEQRVCYAFAKVRCEQAGKLVIGAGADWWMQWFLDGRSVYNTLASGNGAKPYSPANHTFAADVEAGEHVLAVMVKAGSAGWCLASAGGTELAARLRTLRARPEPHKSWGYVCASGDLLIGSGASPRLARSGSTSIFALHKESGELLWSYEAEGAVPATAVAIGQERVFLLDSPMAFLLPQSPQRPGGRQSLTALDLGTGRELWRRTVPTDAGGILQLSQGVLLAGAAAAYDAADGSLLWQNQLRPQRHPVIVGDWVFAQPAAFDLRTGQERMKADPLTGQSVPWQFVRAYGCGSVAGCPNMLFFRSGVVGLLDLESGGTANFGAVRPGCSVNVIAANGLLLMPEGSSGCTCSYNYQTSVAFIPERRDAAGFWYVHSSQPQSVGIQHLRVNLGAPGDRVDADGNVWLGWPRPAVSGACPAPIAVEEGQGARCRAWGPTPAAEADCLATSGLEGDGQVTVFTAPASPVVIERCARPPVIDGRMDDPAWQAARPVPFEYGVHRQAPQTTLLALRDDTNIYFAYRREAAILDGKPVPFVATQTERDGRCWVDDDFELFLAEGGYERGICLAVSCAGGRSDAPIEGDAADADYDWRSRTRVEGSQWTAEIAVPLTTLRAAGIDPQNFLINALSRNRSGVGPGEIYLTHPGEGGVNRCKRFLPVAGAAPDLPERRFTVRLHFAGPEPCEPGERTCDVSIQGQPVLSGFDVAREPGGRGGRVVKEFPDIAARDAITLELKGRDGAGPALCAVEVLAQPD